MSGRGGGIGYGRRAQGRSGVIGSREPAPASDRQVAAEVTATLQDGEG